MKKETKNRLLRMALLVSATIVLLLLLPHNDAQNYVYEPNQPWRYPLLMADFDMEIKRDSASAQQMRDSINRNFQPIVKRAPNVEENAATRFNAAITNVAPAPVRHLLVNLLHEIYGRGVVDSHTYERIRRNPHNAIRVANKINGAPALTVVDAAEMLSPAMAFEYLDSAYRESGGPMLEEHNEEIARALNAVLVPNIVLDTVADSKYRAQDYLAADASIGVIKKGQRIVDRGEIVTPQIYTNLNTYMQKLEESRGEHDSTYFYIGQALFIIIWLGCLYMFLKIYRPAIFRSIKQMTFIMSFITLFAAFAILMFEYLNNGIFLVPFAAVAVVIMVFFDARTAIFSLLVTVLISSLVAIDPHQFIFLELIAGLSAALSIHILSQRSQLLRTAAITFLAYLVCYTTMLLLDEGTLHDFEWRLVGMFAINAVVLSFVYILILVIEKIFGFTSTVTLVELSDINNPMLRRLAEEAPGTFQHSMQVSTLASEAARAINANTQLVRTGALYHDIGKLDSPIFFTENQHGVNPHAGLDPEVSAHKIISHVTQGLQLAQKIKLPQVVRAFIPEHHGRSVTRYFYNTAVNNCKEGDEPVDKKKFMYPGPNPRSRETAILMMADSVEAASRSLSDYSPEAINNLVDKIIDTQVKDGLFNESPISFRDIEIIKDTFKKRLGTIYHARVAYPELKKSSTSES